MNVDTEEFLNLRGQLAGLSARADELAAKQAELTDSNAGLRYICLVLQRDIGVGLEDLTAALDRRLPRDRPVLRAITGSGRGGRHRRGQLAAVDDR